MRRVGGITGACAAMYALVSLLACSSASDSPATSAAAPVAGVTGSTPVAGAAVLAADSSGRAAVATMVAAASSAGAAAQPGPAGAAGAAAGTGGMSGASAGPTAVPSAAGAGSAAVAAGAGTAAAMGGMGGIASDAFILTPVGFPMAGSELTFPQTANPPTNQSPEFSWTGVPADARSLALAFRDLGNDAVKWIIWDMPPSLTHIPPNIMPVAMPPEVPGSSQLGSLDNQGYAGPGSGARQYDFTLWALDTDKLPVTARMTTVQIHELLELHELAKTPPVLVRNTRNL